MLCSSLPSCTFSIVSANFTLALHADMFVPSGYLSPIIPWKLFSLRDFICQQANRRKEEILSACVTFTEDYEGHAQSKGRHRTNPRCVITLRDDCHLLVLIFNLKNFYSTSLLRAEDSEMQTNTLCKHRLLKRTRQKILKKQ